MRVNNISRRLIAVLMSIIPICSIAADSLSSSTTPPQDKTTQVDAFLKPYTAVYSTIWRKGISLKVEGKQTLSKQTNNTWQFVFSANSMIASLDEMSAFYVDNHQIIPTKYQYKSSVLGKKRTAILTFDWDKGLVKNDIKNKPWNLAIEPKTLDKLSIQLQIRQDVKIGKNNFDYQVADGGRIKNWVFKREGMETINTTFGDVPAIKVIRTDNLHKGKKTSFWFAPKFDYLLIKLEHKEDGESYYLDIDSVK